MRTGTLGIHVCHKAKSEACMQPDWSTELTRGSHYSCCTSLTHDLVDFASTADIIIRKILDIYTSRLFLVNLQIVILSCKARQKKISCASEESQTAYEPASHGYVLDKFPCMKP